MLTPELAYLIAMVAYLCPLCASYFSIKYVDMQDKYVEMQYNCNQIRIIKKISKNLKYRPLVTSKMLDATYLSRHATYLF